MTPEAMDRLKSRLKQRRRAEMRFRLWGRIAIGLSVLALIYLMASIVLPGIPGFVHYGVTVPLTAEIAETAHANPQKAAIDALQSLLPETQGNRTARRLLGMLLSSGAGERLPLPLGEGAVDVFLLLDDSADQYLKRGLTAGLHPQQIAWLDRWRDEGLIASRFNTRFFTAGDSREPELAGFWGSIAGSFFTLLVCVSLALVLGVASAVYLEEFAPKNTFTHLIEVNINNLAAVPSIIFGLLGLSVYLQFFGLPRSAALVGGLTLALMTLPVIIISARVALKAVPPSIREAARGLGASPVQVVAHHVLPYALPGILTGAILGMARAVGETAPLLMIGMVAFIADVPSGFLDPATAMPVQIYLWAGSPEAGFVEKTSTGIIVLLMMLLLLNAAAIWLRRKFEIRW